MARIAGEFGLETYREYHARATALQDAARDHPVAPPERSVVSV